MVDLLAIVLVRELFTLQVKEAPLAWRAGMKTTRCYLLAIVILAIPTATTPSAPTPSPPEAARWDQILEWLPEDTETLIVAPRPFVIPKREPDSKALTEQLTASELLPIFTVLPFSEDNGMLDKELAGLKCLCIVEGSRCFTPPGQFGLMPYQGAHILQFDPASADAVRKAFQACLKKADKEIELLSQAVAVFTRQQERDKWTYYVAQPRPGVLICATHKGYLEETLKRIGSKPKKRALPADLPEWKHVDLKARVWAIRHYRVESADNDPSSPLNGKAGGKEGNDNAAVGVVFWYNPETSKVLQARYLSGAKDAVEIASKDWVYPSPGFKPKIKKADPGVVEITVEFSKDNENMFVFVLLLQLGHGIII
jgi:hypothetical protein